MVDIALNLVLGSGGIALSLFGPWDRASWSARVLFAAAAFNVVLGVASLG